MEGLGDKVENKENHTNVYFTFGRFQPPTIGHKVLFDQLARLAAENNANAYVFVSSKKNDLEKYLRSKKYKDMQSRGYFESGPLNENPLSVYEKVKYLKKMYADSNTSFINTTECGCTNIFKSLDALRSVGYTNLSMVVGSDRRDEFARILEGITVIPAGEERTVNAKSMNTKSMSGTKMREAAVRGDIETLKYGTLIGSMREDDVKQLMNDIRRGLGYDEVPKVGGGNRKMTIRRNRLYSIKIKTRRRGAYKLRSDEVPYNKN